MNVHEAIEKRHSVRSFDSRPVESDKLQRILESARLAPTARNVQDLKLIVVQDSHLRQEISKATGQPFVAQAPVILAVVSLDPVRKMHCGVPAGPVDCAILLDHVSLAAVEEGLGSCWIGHFDQDSARKILDVPKSAQIISLMPLGCSTSATLIDREDER